MTYHELNQQELKEAYKYYPFFVWLYENGWEPYVDESQYINQKAGKILDNVKYLWHVYFSELPQSIKDAV